MPNQVLKEASTVRINNNRFLLLARDEIDYKCTQAFDRWLAFPDEQNSVHIRHELFLELVPVLSLQLETPLPTTFVGGNSTLAGVKHLAEGRLAEVHRDDVAKALELFASFGGKVFRLLEISGFSECSLREPNSSTNCKT